MKSLNSNKRENKEEIIYKEIDILIKLFIESEKNVQSIFNYYILFVSALLGALAFLIGNHILNVKDFGLILILLFNVFISFNYLTSIVERYSRLGRYGYAIDGLRRLLLKTYNKKLPEQYSIFINKINPNVPLIKKLVPRYLIWLIYILPTGSYQTIIATIISASVSWIVWIYSTNELYTGMTLFIFFISMNYFSRYHKQWFINTADVSVDIR